MTTTITHQEKGYFLSIVASIYGNCASVRSYFAFKLLKPSPVMEDFCAN